MSITFDILRKANSGWTTVNGYQALPFVPAGLITRKGRMNDAPYDEGEFAEKAKQSVTGEPLRKYKNGVYYFMPVSFEHTDQKTKVKSNWEFDEAIVSVSSRKTIVETTLTGRKGKVKELISMDDYEIKLLVVLAGDDYPEEKIQELVRLWKINEAVKMRCAVTAYFLEKDDSVVIKDIDFPAMEGNEDMQVITMNLLSDSPFELSLP